MKKRKLKLNIRRDDVPVSVSNSKILAIDPGTKKLGYCIYQLNDKNLSDPIAYGVLHFKGIHTSEDIFSVAEAIENKVKEHNIEEIFCEDYHFIPGRTNGIFQVVQLISAIRLTWYKHSKKEVIFISSFDWKTSIVGLANGNKTDVRTKLAQFISRKLWKEIEETFTSIITSKSDDKGYQDCLDAIAIGKHVDIRSKIKPIRREL